MNIEFISKQQSLELKEIGFDEPCLACYYEDGTFAYHPDSDAFVDAPIYQQAFRWFRERCGYITSIFNTEFIIYTEYSKAQTIDMVSGKLKPAYIRTIIHQESKDSY
jgi:hypothetical protein